MKTYSAEMNEARDGRQFTKSSVISTGNPSVTTSV